MSNIVHIKDIRLKPFAMGMRHVIRFKFIDTSNTDYIDTRLRTDVSNTNLRKHAYEYVIRHSLQYVKAVYIEGWSYKVVRIDKNMEIL